LETKIPKIKPNKHLLSAALAVTAVASILYLGMMFERSRQIDIPANQQCQNYAVAVKKQLEADTLVIYGHERPEAPSAKEVKSLETDCIENIERYELRIEASK
jgi:hypothetical protein